MVLRAHRRQAWTLSDGVLFHEESEGPQACLLTIGGGELFAYTARAPDKPTQNEDTVAALP